MRTARRTLSVMCVLLFLSASPNVRAQTPCASNHCVYLPSVKNAVTGPIQIQSFGIFTSDNASAFTGVLRNTLSKDIYQVTLRETEHLPSGTTTTTQTFDVIFANETLSFQIPSYLGYPLEATEQPLEGFFDFTVTSWKETSNRRYRRATATIQSVVRSGHSASVYGTVQNENASALHGLQLHLNAPAGGTLFGDDIPDTLAPHAKVSFSFSTEGSGDAPLSVRAYGYLTP